MPRSHATRAAVVVLALAVLSAVSPTPSPSPAPTPFDARRLNSVVMDVDLTEQAAAGGNDALDIVGTIQLILDRIAAHTAPRNSFGQERSIIWLPLNANKECSSPNDAGILEVRVAQFDYYDRQWLVIGRQSEAADVSFSLLDCYGRVILNFPSNGATYASARFSPYYFSIGGTAAAIALTTARSNNLSIAATAAVINGYGPLQANVGEHDPAAMRELALFRLVGNIPGKDVPPPAPGSVSALLEHCRFSGSVGGSIALICPPQS